MLAIIDETITTTTPTVIDLAAAPLAYLAGMANKRSRDVQKQALDKMASLLTAGKIFVCTLFPWHSLKFQHTTALRSKLIEIYKPATVNRFLTSLRGVLRAAWRLGYMSAEEFQRAADVKSTKVSTLPTGREIAPSEIYMLLAACAFDPTPAGVRDAAMLALLYGCGLRRAEIAFLSLTDYDRENNTLTVHGKGNKDRYTYPPEGSRLALVEWLTFRGSLPGGLFVRLTPTGKLANMDNLTSQTVYNILKERARSARVENVTPHDMRRTFVSDLLDKGSDLALVARMVGHSNVQTTARYDRRPEMAKRKAANTLTIPYTARSK